MAFLWKDPRSRFWQAGWKDVAGKRRNRSTKIEAKAGNRRTAQKMADVFEAATRKQRTVRQLREVVANLSQEITGGGMEATTTAEYFERFLARKQGEVGRMTMGFYHTLQRDFLEWLGARATEDLDRIRPHDIAAFRNHILERITEATATNKMQALRSLFRAAHLEGLILEDPTAGMRLRRRAGADQGRAQRRPFTVEELKLILDHCTGEWRSMVMFGLYTGQRLGDLATLRWSSLDLVKGELRLATRKSNRAVVIPMAKPLTDHIADLPAPDDPKAYVHPGLGDLYEANGSSRLSGQFCSILADCGLRRESHKSSGNGRRGRREGTIVSFHSLRATAVTLLHEAGVPAATVEEWVGHDSPEVHRTYIKIGRESLQKASEALPDLMTEPGKEEGRHD